MFSSLYQETSLLFSFSFEHFSSHAQWCWKGLLGINDTWYKRRFGEITDFNEANNTGYMFVDKTQSLDNKPNTSSNYGFLETIAINEVTIKQTFVDFQSRFLFEYVIMELGLIGNKYKQHSIKNKSYFNEIKRMGAGPHPSAPHVTKEL